MKTLVLALHQRAPYIMGQCKSRQRTIVFRVRKQWDYLSRTHLQGENSSPLSAFYTDQYINASFGLLKITMKGSLGVFVGKRTKHLK